MAFGSFGDFSSPVPGFPMSDTGSKALGGIKGEEQGRLLDVAGQTIGARARFKETEALARAQQYAADKQYQAATNPGVLIADIFGDALSGFTGGLGRGVGASLIPQKKTVA